ncbi:hypothetical protein B0O80DRAFT_446267 [Mortierella sp. GBAus27b]|nr:hypothetical protein B0O80DRAFT_446267 [Mortierella sp. GBAus27b]
MILSMTTIMMRRTDPRFDRRPWGPSSRKFGMIRESEVNDCGQVLILGSWQLGLSSSTIVPNTKACLCEWGKTIVQKEALQLSAEYLRLFTIEALHRTAAYQREQEDEELRNEESLIELDSLEAITPQLVLDF